jgi:hypothetical protein
VGSVVRDEGGRFCSGRNAPRRRFLLRNPAAAGSRYNVWSFARGLFLLFVGTVRHGSARTTGCVFPISFDIGCLAQFANWASSVWAVPSDSQSRFAACPAARPLIQPISTLRADSQADGYPPGKGESSRFITSPSKSPRSEGLEASLLRSLPRKLGSSRYKVWRFALSDLLAD